MEIFRRPLFVAGFLLGVGLGGFADGIFLHNLLQWHHIVCQPADCRPVSIANLSQMVLLDGYFYLVVWMITIAGSFALFRAMRRPGVLPSGRMFVGALLSGWGFFNILDSLVNHHALQLHHIRPGPMQSFWDTSFLLAGVLLFLLGYFLARWAIGEKRSLTVPGDQAQS